ncbi:MAG: ectoine hydroxylase-related dioxygenase (phytanoyl-CoA dioxygenase family) [Paracoccaceae bacterium]|jgi:ectoine hydroxylase-related dioxygenase (phytanoyl-CoA dioxygenase family)
MIALEIPVLKADGAAALPAPIASHAAGRFTEAGVMVLKDLLLAERISALQNAYAAQCGDITHRSSGDHIKEVGDKRLMISLAVSDAFAAPDTFANPVALSLVGALLGDDFILGSYVAVTSMPGAKAQRLHADQEGLFGDVALDSGVPSYSITLVIPLVGLNPTTGSTCFFPGTHHDPDADPDGIAPDLQPGDAILFDSRISHGGMANLSDAPRPIIYCTYHRAWYRDVSNFRDMPPMLIDEAALDAMNEEERALVDWVRTESG